MHEYDGGVRKELRGGDCLKQSCAFLTGMRLEDIPNFHRLQVSNWKKAFESWLLNVVGQYNIIESLTDKPCIAIFRLADANTNERLPLHAVIWDGESVVFDCRKNKVKSKLSYFVRGYELSEWVTWENNAEAPHH